MNVHVLFFAILKERLQRAEGDYEVRPGETVAELASRLLEPLDGGATWKRSLLFAVNNRYIDANYTLQEGDEVALIPPVAGG